MHGTVNIKCIAYGLRKHLLISVFIEVFVGALSAKSRCSPPSSFVINNCVAHVTRPRTVDSAPHVLSFAPTKRFEIHRTQLQMLFGGSVTTINTSKQNFGFVAIVK